MRLVSTVTVLAVLASACAQEVVELAPAAPVEDDSAGKDSVEARDADASEPEDAQGDDRETPDADARPERDGRSDQKEVGVCEKTCYLLDDCGFLDIPGSPFGNTLEACLQGAGSPACDKLWDLDPNRAECVLNASTCKGLWLCLI